MLSVACDSLLRKLDRGVAGEDMLGRVVLLGLSCAHGCDSEFCRVRIVALMTCPGKKKKLA